MCSCFTICSFNVFNCVVSCVCYVVFLTPIPGCAGMFRELPGMDPHLAPEQIASLGELYGDGDTAPTNARQVRENADRYARYYFHATPFQRAALRSVGARCRGEQCIEARHDAAQRIGGTRN